MSTAPNLVATGNVYPCRFVKVGATSNSGAQATAGDPAVGISQNWTRSVNLEGAISVSSPYIAIAGEGIPLWGLGQEALLELGGTVAAGNRLKSDADGKGVVAAAADGAYAVALQSGVSGNFIRVVVVYDSVGAA